MNAVLAFTLYDWHYFFAQLVAGLTTGSLYALLALGYTMVYGILKLLNFAHGDVYMIGAYIGYFVLTALGGSTSPSVPLNACSKVKVCAWAAETVTKIPSRNVVSIDPALQPL